jgi:DNA-binding response OmpR family regulator
MNDSTPVSTVLIVDDNPRAVYAKRRLLERQGYRVLEATTGQAALDIAASARPDVVVLDINLPDIDGFEVSGRLKRAPATRYAKILHISAVRTDALDRVKGLECGADAYLIEPAEEEELVGTVRALLGTGARQPALDREIVPYGAAAAGGNRIRGLHRLGLEYRRRHP